MYPKHSNQLWPGYVPQDAHNPDGGLLGQVNPRDRMRLNMEYGRNLAGLGRTEGWGGDSEYDERSAKALESDDDVVGSGIFDMPGHKNTVHETLGVFADHPNLPGYIARELPFRVSDEVESVPSGAEVITVPGGGMTWGGRLIGGGTSTPLAPRLPVGGGERPVNAFKPGRIAKMPTADTAPQRSVKVGTVAPRAALVRQPGAQGVPARPAFPVVAGRFNPDAQRNLMARPLPPAMVRRAAPMHGLGADSSGPGILPYVFGGILLGAAGAIFKRYVIDKK